MASSDTRKRTALILTVLNEADSIDALLDSVARQTHAPDAVVVADGGSTDGTREAMRRWSERLPLRVIEAPGANIATGRNRAIAAADADIIAVTDAGVRLRTDWLQRLGAALTPEV